MKKFHNTEVEHECILLINAKMLTIARILTFITRINTKQGKSLYFRILVFYEHIDIGPVKQKCSA